MPDKFYVQSVFNKLKEKNEMEPSKHDGCYELMLETVEAYSNLKDLSVLDYHDLDLVYLTTVGTWRQGMKAKQKLIEASHLSIDDKNRLKDCWNDVWAKAKRGEYGNFEQSVDANDSISIGLFGTGFFTFNNKSGITASQVQDFICMLIKILPLEDDNDIFNIAEKTLKKEINGMQAASASQILHCLKPKTFPILNNNMGNEDIYELLGVSLDHKKALSTYVSNCRKIKEFRDRNFSIKNYRIFDIEARQIQQINKKVWLISWNIDKWHWKNYKQACIDTISGHNVIDNWSCANTNPQKGDDVFLIKLGSLPRGIIGHGHVIKESYKAESFDSKKAAEGVKNAHIDVEFDRLIDYENEMFISQDELNNKCKGQNWSPQQSGIEIKKEVLPTLFELWKNVTRDEERYGFSQMISFLSEYGGKNYKDPDKAGEQSEYMRELCQQGQNARANFKKFITKITSFIPSLDCNDVSKWKTPRKDNKVADSLWVELKNKEFEDCPQSIALALEKHRDELPGEDYYLSVKIETRITESDDTVNEQQLRLLNCKLEKGMFFRVEYKDGSSKAFFDAETVKILRDEGKIERLLIIKAIEKSIEKDNEGTILFETLNTVREFIPYYEYVIGKNKMFNSKSKEDELMFNHSQNTILYGPPGTGKTYKSVIYAVAICENKSIESVENESYEDVLARYNQLRDAGRISFTTFHQSYGYEEFIEGIKPKLDDQDTIGYTIEDGIFKAFCKRASAVSVYKETGAAVKQKPRIWGMILGGTGMTPIKQKCFENNEIRLGFREISDDNLCRDYDATGKISQSAIRMISDFKNTMEIGDIVVIEKNNKSIDAIGIITGDYKYDITLDDYQRSRTVEWLVKDIDQDVVCYLPNGRKQLARCSLFALDYVGLDVILQILSKFKLAQGFNVETEIKPYVFIIDEINRGNISKIFGELITLIEGDKRAGNLKAMEAVLPYSGEPFSVPKNVYILGTMNTADRSIALMDTALRRRFEFIEMMPDSNVLKDIEIAEGDEKLNISRMLDIINERIEYLYDREHTIGHAFFDELRDNPTVEKLACVFEKKIIPLLQEYFYEDYEKIQLVLGDNTKEEKFKFILDKPVKVDDVFNGTPDFDLPEKRYTINHSAFTFIDSYKKIGKDL